MSLDVQAQQPELKPDVVDTELGSMPGPVQDVAPEADDVAPEADIVVGVKKRVEPVAAGERFFAVDVLRGFALLGILAMNIVAFGWPEPAYGNPFRGGGFEGFDRGVWFFN